MNALIQDLLREAPVLTDGAWGTQLQARGLPLGESPDLWNLSHPEFVEEVAASYVSAGSRIILTNTLGSTRIALARHGMSEKAAEINRVSAGISRKAAGDAAYVFASVGPTGVLLALGDLSEEEVYGAYAEQAWALAEGGAHGFVIETMSDLMETTIAVRAAKETNLPVVACMVFDSGKNQDRTLTGVTPERAAQELADAGADVIGSNCGKGAAEMLPICERLRAATTLPLWMKPNAGLPELIEGQAIYKTPPEEFAQNALALTEAGAAFIGGCCGTSPVFIAALSSALSS